MRKIRSAFVIKATLAVVFAVISGSTAQARDNRPLTPAAPDETNQTVALTPAQTQQFETALKAVAAQTQTAFVIEGVPLHSTLTEDKAPNIQNGVPAEEAVKKLARAYDYEATRRGDLFLFKKRYTDPYDLPGVTLEEYTLAMRDVVRLLSAHGPQPPISTNTKFVLEFAKTITPEQQRAMQDSGLPLTALSPAQQTQMRRMALQIYVGSSLEDATSALFLLRQAPKSVLCRKNMFGRVTFGFEYTSAGYSKPAFQPVNGGLDPTAFHSGSSPLPGSQTTEPDLKAEKPIRSTLGNVIANLNVPSNAEPGKASFKIDAALADKPVVVIGRVGPSQLMAGLADVYGLRVVVQEDGTQTLTRPGLRIARNLADLPRSVLHSFPDPLLRALHIDAVDVLEQQQQKWRQISHDPKASIEQRTKADEEATRLFTEQQRLNAFPSVLVQKAAWRLRAMVEPALNKSGEGARVPVATLGKTERSAFALTLLENFFQGFNSKFHQEPPLHLAFWNQVYLKGGPSQGESGQQKYGVFLSVIDPNDSHTDRVIGIGGINYPGL